MLTVKTGPENLFRNLIRKITKFENDADKFSVEDFEKAINDLVGSTMGHESNKAFDGLFNDMRLQDSRLGETVSDRTEMIGRVMVRVSDIDFDLQDSQFDVLGTAYMILIGLFASDAGKKGGEFFTPAGPSKLCATLAALGLHLWFCVYASGSTETSDNRKSRTFLWTGAECDNVQPEPYEHDHARHRLAEF